MNKITHAAAKKIFSGVVDYALDLGFKNCYIQQGKTATTKFVPHFDGTNVY